MIRFTLRDVFWLTLVAACLAAWSVEAFRSRELQKSCGRLYDENEELFRNLYPGVHYTGPKKPPPSPWRWPSWP